MYAQAAIKPNTYEKPDPTIMTKRALASCAIEDCTVSYTITRKQFEKFIRTIYEKALLADWKRDYCNPHVMDGASMTVIVGKQQYGCLNEWPPYFHELFSVMRKEFKKAGFRLE